MKLTDEQIAELAPEWAEFYFVNVIGDIVFQNANNYVIMDRGKLDFGRVFTNLYGINNHAKPIPRKPKPFDITQHEFSDAMANLKAIKSESGDIVIRIGSSWIFLNKDDSIAIAKALGVTGEDLK